MGDMPQPSADCDYCAYATVRAQHEKLAAPKQQPSKPAAKPKLAKANGAMPLL